MQINIIMKIVIFFIINIVFINIDFMVNNILFTVIFRVILCITTINLLGINKKDLKRSISKVSWIKNLILILNLIVLIIIFRIIFIKNIIPIVYKEDILAMVLYYLSKFIIASYEEVNFRYIFIDLVRKYIKSNKALIIFSSAIFGVIHLTLYNNSIVNLSMLLGAFIFGLSAHYITLKYGLFQSSIIHFLYNVSLIIYLPNDLSSSILLRTLYISILMISIIAIFEITNRVLDNKFEKIE